MRPTISTLELKLVDTKKRILFFIGGLVSGGKERRLVELLSYLKKHTHFELVVVTTQKEIHYSFFKELGIRHITLNQKGSLSFLRFPFQIWSVYRSFNPHIIHTWGRKQTLYCLPTIIFGNAKLVNSQITNSPPEISLIDQMIDKLNFAFSHKILSNSKAGISAYGPPKSKSEVIYNGMRMERFNKKWDRVETRKSFKITTEFAVVMVATHSPKKDYRLFFSLAQAILSQRRDVSFVAAGWFDPSSSSYKDTLEQIGQEKNIILTGEIKNVEELVNACDICMLFSTEIHGEGISNSLLEYMALGKPIITNDSGGNKEIIIPGQTGFIINKENFDELVTKTLWLLDNFEERKRLGENSKKMVNENFTIEKMGEGFLKIYQEISLEK